MTYFHARALQPAWPARGALGRTSVAALCGAGITASRMASRFQSVSVWVEDTMTTTLYERLGGAPGIAALVDDVIAAHLVNPVVKTRFENIKDMQHAKRMVREFFGAGAGGA